MTKSEKKIKIAFMTHGVRNIGGGERSLFYLIKNLDRSKFTPIILFVHENTLISSLKKEGIEGKKIKMDSKITSVYRDSITFNPFVLLVYCWFFFLSIIRVYWILKKSQVDIIHPHDNLSKIIGGLAAKLAGIESVVHCRDLLKESVVEKFLKYFQLIIFDRIIAVSKKNKAVFLKNGQENSKIRVIYNGLDVKYFQRKNFLDSKFFLENENEVFIGIIGLLDKVKGHEYLFKALQKIQKENEYNFYCMVIGGGREKDNLLNFVKREGLEGRVRFLGFRDDIAELLTRIQILVMPSIQESFPRAILEAMAMSVPVVCSDVGGMPEAVVHEETGIVFPSKDVDSLSIALKRLLHNEELRKEMGKKGRERVLKLFTIKKNVKRTEALYLELINGCQKNE